MIVVISDKYQPKTCWSNTLLSSSSDRKAHSSPIQPAEAIRVASYMCTDTRQIIRQPHTNRCHLFSYMEAQNHLFRKPHPLCLISVFLLHSQRKLHWALILVRWLHFIGNYYSRSSMLATDYKGKPHSSKHLLLLSYLIMSQHAE